ncbi:MAG: sugar transferase [Calditrichaceae bacterium]
MGWGVLASLEILEHKKLKNTLIVGWNTEAAGLSDKIINYPALGYHVKGFIRPVGFDDERKRHYKNIPVVGGLADIADVIKLKEIDELLIVLSPAEKTFLTDIIKECSRCGVEYRIVADAYDAAYPHVVRDVIKDVLRPQDFGFRRIVDILVSLTLMIVLFPLFFIVAITIKLESRGPVFYSQQRYGKKAKIFLVHKFRSMVQDAERQSGPVWAQKNDPRITKLGHFMRMTRIDELPQLINVLKGDMSLIGPRPERPFFAESLKKQIPLYMNRLKVKPGITGLAQVTVGYDETIDDVRDKVARDIEYIEQADSLKMNLKILWKTFFVVLLGEGQ